MKTPLFSILFLLLASISFGQIETDSVKQNLQQVSQAELPQLPDSLKTPWLKVDSIRQDFNHSADSLQNKYQQSIGAIDRETNAVNHTIDSLENLKLPSNKFTKKLDSLNQERKKVDADFNAKTDQLKAKTIGKLDKVEMTPGVQKPVEEFTQKINGFSVSGDKFSGIPKLDMPGYSLPKVDGLGVGDIGKIQGFPKIDTPVGDLKDVTGQVKGLGGDVKSIAGGDLNNVEQLPKTLEGQATKVEGISELQKSTGAMNEYKEQLAIANDPNAMKEKAATMAQKEAINHFAGKEEQLKNAMSGLSKYKQKYSSVSSIKDLPTRPPNAMKGKPFVERLVPGVYFQLQQMNVWLLDVNPYAGYRISGRFKSGLGWNQRFVVHSKGTNQIRRSSIFGPRAYVDAGLGKGFVAHIEGEAMNTFVPSTLRGNPDVGRYEWVWGMMAGIKKEYKIYKNLRGTVLLQYNIFDRYFKAPYVDRINSRMGFEYALKKKPKKATTTPSESKPEK